MTAPALAFPNGDQNPLRDDMLQRLRDAQLDGLQGKVLYSSIHTLKKGPVYLLGLNPGGDTAKEPITLAEHVAESPSNWNEYLDAMWAPRGTFCSAGSAPMQQGARWLVEQLGLQIREVCASNLLFARSIRQGQLANEKELTDRCWPIHDWIIKLVQPRLILSIGGRDVIDYICDQWRQPRAYATFPSGHGNWMCYMTTVKPGGSTCKLISVPHLGRYKDAKKHPEVPAWIRQMALDHEAR
jgi:hypothetical protein